MALSYQWQQYSAGFSVPSGSWSNVAGATGASHEFTMRGRYRCAVANHLGVTVYSNPANVYDGWVNRLLLGEPLGGMVTDFTIEGGAVIVVDPGTPANDYEGDRTWWSQGGTSPKLTRQASGVYAWSAHNLALYSSDLTNWTNVNTTDSGTTLTASSGNAVHAITRVPATLLADHTYTARVRVKAGTSNFVYLNIRGDGSEDFVTALANLSTVAVTETDVGTSSGTIVSSSIAAVPSYDADAGLGWYDLTVTFRLASVSSPVLAVGIAGAATGNTWDSTGTTAFNAAGTETVQIKRAQINHGYAAVEHVATTAAAAFTLAMHYDATYGWGALIEDASTALTTHNRDLSQAAWTKTDTTAVRDQTGIDGVANTASKLTASGANGTCLQAIVSSSATRTFAPFVKRMTGTGTVEVTCDGGATWEDITAALAAAAGGWHRAVKVQAAVTDPSFGFRLATSGDAIAVDFATGHSAEVPRSPYPVHGAAVTRAADSIAKAVTALPWSATAGMVVVKVITPIAATTQHWIFGITDGTADERIGLLRNGTNLQYLGTDGAVAQWSMNLLTSGLGSAEIVAGVSWESNSVKGSGNAGAVTTDTSATLPTVTVIRLGGRNTATLEWDSLILGVLYLPRLPTADAELQTAQTEMLAA